MEYKQFTTWGCFGKEVKLSLADAVDISEVRSQGISSFMEEVKLSLADVINISEVRRQGIITEQKYSIQTSWILFLRNSIELVCMEYI